LCLHGFAYSIDVLCREYQPNSPWTVIGELRELDL
jgi:hypothetical protein